MNETKYETLNKEKINHNAARTKTSLSKFLREKKLTPHEICVVYEVIKGLKHRRSAEELNIKETALKWHLTKVYKKLGIKSKSELIVLCRDILNGEVIF